MKSRSKTVPNAKSHITVGRARSLRLAFVTAACLGIWTGLTAAPFRPTSPDTVLVRLPASLAFPEPRTRLQALPSPPSSASSTQPEQPVASAVQQSRRWILAARRDADPRLLGRARIPLHPWWNLESAPVEVLLLRAEIRQGLHDFRAALSDLDRALAQDPRHPGAWLMKTTILQALGEYESARRSCLQLTRHADALTAITATAGLSGLQSGSTNAIDRLKAALDQNAAAPTSTRAWGYSVLAELQARAGFVRDAETNFRHSLELDSPQPHTLALLADLLLESGRSEEVIRLLEGSTADALRLRLAEARVRTAPDAPETQELVASLAEGFALSRIRGDDLHLREHARFVLRIEGRAAEATALAKRNWQIQKEPADLQLLIEATRAAGDTHGLDEALAWGRRYQPAVLALGNSR